MKKCYCYETDTYYDCIKDCLKAIGVPESEYTKLTIHLNKNDLVETAYKHYHIGYNKEAVLKEIETWKQPIPDIDVEVNRLGEVRKKSTKMIRTPLISKFGYAYINISLNGKQRTFQVHRLVAQAFLPEFKPDLVIDHLNGIRWDNRLENLRVKTQAENIQARDANNKPLYEELRRIIITYGYDKTMEILKQY